MRHSCLAAIFWPLLLYGCADHSGLQPAPATPPQTDLPDIPSDWHLVGEYPLKDENATFRIKLYSHDSCWSWPNSLWIYAVYRADSEKWKQKELYYGSQLECWGVIESTEDHVILQLRPAMMINHPGELKEALERMKNPDPKYQVRISMEHGEPKLERVSSTWQRISLQERGGQE